MSTVRYIISKQNMNFIKFLKRVWSLDYYMTWSVYLWSVIFICHACDMINILDVGNYRWLHIRLFHSNTRSVSYSFLYKESQFLLCLNINNIIPVLLWRARISQSVQCLGYWLYVRGITFWFPADTKLSSRLQILQTGCGCQPTTYSIRTGGTFHWVQATGL